MILSCARPQKVTIAEKKIIDSFEVNGIESMDDLLYLQFMDDTSLATFNTFASELHTFKKKGKDFAFFQTKELKAGVPFHTFWIEKDGSQSFNIVDGHNNYYRFDKNLLLTKSLKFETTKPALKDQYIINGNKTIPTFMVNDTIISTYYYKNYEDYSSYFMEPVIAENIPYGDSLLTVNQYFYKPGDLINHAIPFPKYCFHNNKIALVYPCYDTLYVYDRSTRQTTKHVIHNKEYLNPGKWDYKKMYAPEFNSYFTKYQLHNFFYHAIFYNQVSKHFLLFFKSPVAAKNKDQNPVPEDQHLQLLVLNEGFEILDYYIFSRNYVNPTLFLFYPGKGLAMPLVNKENNYGKTKFYVFNF